MDFEPDNRSPDAATSPAALAQQLVRHGFDKLPESEIPAINDAWQAIGDHAAILRKHRSGRGS